MCLYSDTGGQHLLTYWEWPQSVWVIVDIRIRALAPWCVRDHISGVPWSQSAPVSIYSPVHSQYRPDWCVSKCVCAFQPSTVTCTCWFLTCFLFNYCVCAPAFSSQPPGIICLIWLVWSQPTLEQTKKKNLKNAWWCVCIWDLLQQTDRAFRVFVWPHVLV